MKKLIFTFMLLFLLTGCSEADIRSLTEKVPFLSDKDSNQTEETTNHEETSGDSSPLSDQTKESGQNQDTEKQNEHTLKSAYFNEIKQVSGKNIIQNPANELALVNKLFGLPEEYIPEDLVRADVAFSFGDQKVQKSLLRKEAADALEQMFAAANKDGMELFAVSGYRSFSRQNQVFIAEVKRSGEEKAVQAVAFPGNSEHQTGLAMDISSRSAGFGLTEQFGTTAEGMWLAENAHRFGYILRYPKGKEEVTGYKYEPWHFRYVGKEAATDIYENNWTLEEFFNIVEEV